MDGTGSSSDKVIMLNLVSKWCDVCRHHINILKMDDIKKIIERNFLLMIIDIDEKPYLWNRFNFGGLPSIVFLSPNNEILYGYSGFLDKEMIKKILEIVLSEKTEKYNIQLLSEEVPPQEDIDESIIYKIVNKIEANFDWLYGSFIEDYKHIHFQEHLFLLNLFLETGVKGYGLMVQKTLDQLSVSEMRNLSIGGFYRYAKNMNWSSPDKKFLIEVNSNLLSLYASAYRVFRNAVYGHISEELEKFIDKKLFDREKELFIRGIYNDKTYDNRHFLSLNMYTVESLLKTYKLGGNKKLVEKALKILGNITSKKYVRHYLDNESSEYYLSDIIFILRSLLAAYEVTGDKYWIEEWRKWIKTLEKNFLNMGGAYNDIPKDSELFMDVIKRAPLKENSLLAENMIRYSYLFEEESYREKAYKILKYYSKLYGKYGFNVGEYANSCLLYFREPPILYVYRYRKLRTKIRNILLPNFLVTWINKGQPRYIIKKENKIIKFKPPK